MSLLGAVLEPQPFGVRVDGDVYVYPQLRALPWLRALTSEHWVGCVFPGLLIGQQREQAMDGIQYGDLTTRHVNRAAFDAIGYAGGRKWWETYNLCRAGAADPSGALLGRMIISGVDAERVTLAGWCSALYAILVQDAETKVRARIDAYVASPPPIAEAFEDAAGDSYAAILESVRMG